MTREEKLKRKCNRSKEKQLKKSSGYDGIISKAKYSGKNKEHCRNKQRMHYYQCKENKNYTYRAILLLSRKYVI